MRSLIVCLSILLLFCCKKTSHVDSRTDLNDTQKVITWLDNKISESNDKDRIEINRLKKAIINKEDFREPFRRGYLVIYPLPYYETLNTTTFSTLKYAVFIENENGEITAGNIIELVDNKKKLTTYTPNTFSFIYDNRKTTFQGLVEILSITNKFSYELEYANERLIKTGYINIRPSSKKSSKENGRCIDWYLVTTSYYSDGSSNETWQYLYTSCETFGSGDCAGKRIIDQNPISSYKEVCGSSYETVANNLVTVQEIKDSLTVDCFKKAKQALTDENLKNFITRMYQRFYVGYGNTHTVIFTDKTPLPLNVAGRTKFDILTGNITISLNPNSLNQYNTQEEWVGVIAHELLHGFMSRYNLGGTFKHAYMLEQFGQDIMQLLQQAFGMSVDDSKSFVVGSFKYDLELENPDITAAGAWDPIMLGLHGITFQTALNNKAAYKLTPNAQKCQ